MSSGNERIHPRVLHPIHGALLAGAIPLFLGALISDYAYSVSYHVQWANFASWLIVGGLIFSGCALLWSIIHLIFFRNRDGLTIGYSLLILITWILGLYNALIHTKDAWATMPIGMIMSLFVVLFACISTWIGFAKFGVGGTR